jgi:hypothetical protein
MKGTGRSMRPTVFLLIVGLAVGVLATGIVAATQQAKSSANKRSVVVPLLTNASGDVTGVGVPVSDDEKSKGKDVGLSKGKGHFAEWVTSPSTADVTLKIGMKENDPYPFAGSFTASGNTVTSTKLLATAKEGIYKYWVKVHDNKTGKDFPLDPDIRVDP